jgi:hypothetical protein
MRRHTITLAEMDYESPVTLASTGNERGSKRLTMFSNAVSKQFLFHVASGSALREHWDIEAAIADYNGIDI